MDLTAAEIAAATDGAVARGRAEALARSFSIDTRAMEPEGCFIAIEAARDGHDFVGDAFARGATVAVVRKASDESAPNGTLVLTADTTHAVTALGRLARARLARSARVVGITGSAGKTATKDLTAAAVAPRLRVHASHLSFNNELGLPLTLLGADSETQVVIVEMGARLKTHISALAEVARPDIGVVTHVGMAHAEHLGGRAGIIDAKGELVEALPPSGLAVLNADDDATPELARRTKARVLRVGTAASADVVVEQVALDRDLRPTFQLRTPWGGADVRLELRGAHQALNAAMATAVAAELGVPLPDAVAGLADARPAPHRMTVSRSSGGVTVINDSYNSSPTSAAAALRSLAGTPVDGHRVAVLGEMRELGKHADREHARVGELTAAAGVDLLIVVGDGVESLAVAAEQAGVEVLRAADPSAAASVVAARVRPGDAVLVKASRAVGLEELAESLTRGQVAP